MKELPDYSKNSVITEIFKEGIPEQVSAAFSFIKNKYKTEFCEQHVLQKHYFIPADTLKMIAEETFNDAMLIFFEKVRTGVFKAEGAGYSSFLLKTFKYCYVNAYGKEVTQQYNARLLKNKEVAQVSQDNPDLNAADGFRKFMRELPGLLDSGCASIVTMVYFEHHTQEELLQLTGVGTKDALNAKMRRCKEKLKEIIANKSGIRFKKK